MPEEDAKKKHEKLQEIEFKLAAIGRAGSRHDGAFGCFSG